jgi:hypothetical protein
VLQTASISPLGPDGLQLPDSVTTEVLVELRPPSFSRGLMPARTKPSPPYKQPRHTRPVSGSGARQVSEGLLALGADTVLRLIAALAFVQTFLRGCATVLVVVVAIDLLGGGDAYVGVLNAGSARWSARCSPRRSPGMAVTPAASASESSFGAPRSPSSAERPRRPPRCCSSPRSESATRSSTSAPTRCPNAWRPTP